MQFPYLAPRSAKGPIRLEEYIGRERVNVMADDAWETSERNGGVPDRYPNLATPPRITPEYKAWHARQMARLHSK